MFKKYLRVFNPRTQLSIFLFIWATFFILTSLLQHFIMLQFAEGTDFNSTLAYLVEHKPMVVKAMNTLHSILLFLLPAYLFAYWVQPSPLSYLKLKDKPRPKVVALSIVLGMLLIPVLVSLSAMIKESQLFGQIGEDLQLARDQNLKIYMEADGLWGILSNLFLLGLVPAICEELLFRGVLQRLIAENFKRKIWSIILPSLAFTFLHFSVHEFIPILLGGVLLSLVYHYSQSLKLSILIHFINNGMQVVLLNISGNQTIEVSLWIYGLVFLLGTIVMVVIWNQWKYALKSSSQRM